MTLFTNPSWELKLKENNIRGEGSRVFAKREDDGTHFAGPAQLSFPLEPFPMGLLHLFCLYSLPYPTLYFYFIYYYYYTTVMTQCCEDVFILMLRWSHMHVDVGGSVQGPWYAVKSASFHVDLLLTTEVLVFDRCGLPVAFRRSSPVPVPVPVGAFCVSE